MSVIVAEEKSGSFMGRLIKRIVFIALPIIVVVGAVAGVGVMGALQPPPEEKEEVVEALSVTTTEVVLEPVKLKVMSQGEVTARAEVDLAPQINGRLEYVSPKFLPGSQFRRGDILFRLENRDFQLRVTQAEGAIAQARTALIREQSEADQARKDAEALGLTDVSDLALRRPQVAEAETRLQSAIASLEEAKLQLERTIIRAPFDGRVRSKTADVGAFVSPGMSLGRIYSSDVVDVPLPLTDADLASLGLGIGFQETASNPGPEVTLIATIAGEQHRWTGRISRTDSGYDSNTRVLFAYATVQDPYGAGADNGVPLANGLFVSAEMEGRQLVDTKVIPRTALRGKDKVYIAQDDDTLEIREVVVATSDRRRAVITEGITAGEIVITSPVRGAADGMKIKPVTTDSSTEPLTADSGSQLAQLSEN